MTRRFIDRFLQQGAELGPSGGCSTTHAAACGKRVTAGYDPPVTRRPQDTAGRQRPGGSAAEEAFMRQTTILVADDHAIVKEGLVSLLKQHNFDLVGSVGDGISLVEEARRLRPDIIVADISMPGLSGLEALERITAEKLPCKMILLTMHRDADLAARA